TVSDTRSFRVTFVTYSRGSDWKGAVGLRLCSRFRVPGQRRKAGGQERGGVGAGFPLDRGDAERFCASDILGAVIEEKRVGRLESEAFERVMVYLGLRFHCADFVGVCDVVEPREEPLFAQVRAEIGRQVGE